METVYTLLLKRSTQGRSIERDDEAISRIGSVKATLRETQVPADSAVLQLPRDLDDPTETDITQCLMDFLEEDPCAVSEMSLEETVRRFPQADFLGTIGERTGKGVHIVSPDFVMNGQKNGERICDKRTVKPSFRRAPELAMELYREKLQEYLDVGELYGYVRECPEHARVFNVPLPSLLDNEGNLLNGLFAFIPSDSNDASEDGTGSSRAWLDELKEACLESLAQDAARIADADPDSASCILDENERAAHRLYLGQPGNDRFPDDKFPTSARPQGSEWVMKGCSSWPFAPLPFVQFCLDAWGSQDDWIAIVFQADPSATSPANAEKPPKDRALLSPKEEEVRRKLLKSHNVILHGAPGTGKTHMANRIASHIVTDGACTDVAALSPSDRERIEFVQFHPSYDYTDFVEGLRPVLGSAEEGQAGSIGFAKKDGIFKAFARKAAEACGPEDGDLNSNADIPKHVLIIDEVNRGEVSKIFGELFFAIDPGYRGPKGKIKTQYASMDGSDGKECSPATAWEDDKIYVPENVYIIGTMNDIDRSVDNFDFAMHRRFRFLEITADDTKDMLEDEKPKAVMDALNELIADNVNLGSSFQIGASYFMKLANELDGSYEELWNDYLGPLLYEYVRGTYSAEDDFGELLEAYGEQAEVDDPDSLFDPWRKKASGR